MTAVAERSAAPSSPSGSAASGPTSPESKGSGSGGPREPLSGGLLGRVQQRLFAKDTQGEQVFPLAVLSTIYFFDEFDTAAFGTLGSEIQKAFGLSDQALVNIVILNVAVTALLGIPFGFLADRVRRTRLVWISAIVAGLFSLLTGLAGTVLVLILVRLGNGLGLLANGTVHRSLLADYYTEKARPGAYANHTNALYLGAVVGPLLAGGVGAAFGWRAVFFLLIVPIVAVALVARALREPVRGGTDDPDAALAAAGVTLSFGTSVRLISRVKTLRLQYLGAILFGAAFIPIATFGPLFYDREFGVGPLGRGLIGALGGVFTLVGIKLSGPATARWFAAGPRVPLQRAGLSLSSYGFFLLLTVTSPFLWLAVLWSLVGALTVGFFFAPFYTTQALVSPAKVRTLSFSLLGVFIVLGAIVDAATGITGISDAYGIRWGLGVLTPLWMAAGGVLFYSSRHVERDAAAALAELYSEGSLQAAEAEALHAAPGGADGATASIQGATGGTPLGAAAASGALGIASATISQHSQERDASMPGPASSTAEAQPLTTSADDHVHLPAQPGKDVLLSCRGIDAAYGQVQVLFDVDLDIYQGEILALLGTNGAGKSTILKVISGLLSPTGGTVTFDGANATGLPPRKAVELGIVQMPGGRSVFPTLTIAESLRLAGWMYKKSDPDHVKQATAQVLEYFPILRERRDQIAGDLSGGEQQMLGLAMAFIAKPKLLMIDELSLGLAPIIVGQLVDIVRRISAQGTTVVLVEQSVNVALTLAERAIFMEKGEVRFSGRTAELMERGDLLRSVFLEGANASQGNAGAAPLREKRPLPGPDDEKLMEVTGLVKRFGGIAATRNVSFDLYKGEILGIIGPNGAGKTTLFDLVSGYLTPDEGSVVFLGQDVSSWSPDRRAFLGLARSFQDARLFPSLTVAENLGLAFERHLETRDVLAATLGLPAVGITESNVAITVQELIDLLGLRAFAHKFVSELSTGSRRIVDIGMALAHRPDVLILDEPSSGIAQRETEALGPLLTRIHDELGCSLLVIEHDMPLLLSISDRLLALETGALIAEGLPDDVINDPRVVASYLDTDDSVVNRSGSGVNKRLDDGPVEQDLAVVDDVEVVADVVAAPRGRRSRPDNDDEPTVALRRPARARGARAQTAAPAAALGDGVGPVRPPGTRRRPGGDGVQPDRIAARRRRPAGATGGVESRSVSPRPRRTSEGSEDAAGPSGPVQPSAGSTPVRRPLRTPARGNAPSSRQESRPGPTDEQVPSRRASRPVPAAEATAPRKRSGAPAAPRPRRTTGESR